MAVGACGLFETRTPQQPPPPTSGCRSLNIGTVAVVQNVEDFYGRSSGATCYSNCIDPSFTFHPDQQDSLQFLPQEPFISWNDSVEVAANARIASVQKFISVDLVEYGSPIIPDNDTEQRFYDYVIFFQYASTSDTLRFTGKADLTFHRGANGEWKMTTWIDHRGGATDSTWGNLRGTNRP